MTDKKLLGVGPVAPEQVKFYINQDHDDSSSEASNPNRQEEAPERPVKSSIAATKATLDVGQNLKVPAKK